MQTGRKIFINSILFIATLFAVSPVMAIALDDVEIHDSLKHVDDSHFDLAYLLPGADLGKYNKVMLQEVDITFRKNWKRDQNRLRRFDYVRDGYMEKVITRGKALFERIFTEELEQAGYSVVTQPGEDVLLIRPSIFDLDIVAPDLRSPGRVTTFTEESMEAKLSLELYDSTTGQILFHALDKKIEGSGMGLARTNAVTNLGDTIRGMKYWARLLKYDLDSAKHNYAKRD